MKEKVHLGRWRSDEAEQRFRAMEAELMSELEDQPVGIVVDTTAGRTYVHRWVGTGEPIVFLHGMGGVGLMWAGFVPLLPGHDLYAIDTMGDVGRSEHVVAFDGVDDLAVWLDETLAGLAIERAHLVGNSYGGYLALNLAVRRPGRVASIVLLDSAGIEKVNIAKFMLWGIPVLVGSLMPAPIRRWLARRLRMPMLEDKRIMRLALLGQMNHPFRMPKPEPLTDDELRSIHVPVVVLAGAKSEMMPAAKVVARARSLIPNVTAEVVAGAGHALPVSHTELCASRVSHVTDATL